MTADGLRESNVPNLEMKGAGKPEPLLGWSSMITKSPITPKAGLAALTIT